ncbi:MAG: bifunctional glutamate N-acetyltransferase/amino-acid acetyltransferase ArgJ [Candidatus Omnitrophota bacterium]|jgi:glutamate N-acetyltransferase/amino-acid N-acetyltransferase
MKKHKLPKGFLASGIHCGIKKKRKDLSLFYSVKPCKVAALFTTNNAKAAPVILGEKKLMENRHAQAVVVNSGNANCMTGARGLKDAEKMVSRTAEALGIPRDMVMVSSTGVIGEYMPMKTVLKGISRLAGHLSPEGLSDAADGIMTTDRFSKIASRVFTIKGKEVTVTGVAKGAGMIDPNMATMLSYVMTDVNITEGALNLALREGCEASFNAITVDGEMSTNDTVMLLANGQALNPIVTETRADFEVFKKNLDAVMKELAGMIVQDGEGASKFIEVRVKGARTKEEAKKAAGSIANSILVKCAVQGGDPNWGRVASSVGASGAVFNMDKLEISLDGVAFFKKGKSVSPASGKKAKVFKKKNAKIEVNMHSGRSEATAYTCDISKKYLTLNSYYTT